MTKLIPKLRLLFAIGMVMLVVIPASAQRQMENLGRGVVAVRTGTSSIFVSWRLLGLDPAGIGFNLYRSTAGGAYTKLNSSVLTAGTCYTDTTPDITKDNAYYVKPVIGGVEQAASGSYTCKANTTAEPCVIVPLRTPASGYYTKFVWVGDLDGDGEYDFVLDRLAPGSTNVADTTIGTQKVEAYKRDGTFLWSIDMGSGSTNTYNISPGPTAIDMGMYDGVTVYDLAGAGKAVVALKVADGVVFGDGTVFHNADPNKQYLAIVDGMTGKMLANIAFPTDFYSQAGKYGCQLGIAYLDGTTPSVVGWLRNRNSDKSFNDIIVAWHWNGTTLSQTWEYTISGEAGLTLAGDHQLVIADVNGDGKDEICPGNYWINSDGTLRFNLGDDGVIHGDRHYTLKMDPSRAGLQGYGIQQNNPSGLSEYYYDANTGAMLWKHMFSTNDVGRGIVGHIDPRYRGWETWAFSGIFFAPNNTQLTTTNYPYPCQQFWWDDDLLTENLNNGKFEKWDYVGQGVGRLLTVSKFETATGSGDNPMFIGDIFGDWRTEVVYCSSDFSKLIIFTTDIATTNRIYTMAHNPEYRDNMTIKGYMQSPMLDYYMGTGMSTPPVPNITYVGGGGGSIANGTYNVINRASGLALDNKGLTTNGAPVGLWTKGSSNNLKWVTTLQSDGYYKLSCVTGGLYLDGMGGTTNGAPAGQWASDSSHNQEWSIVATGSYYKLVNRTSGLRLDSLGGTTNGAPVGQWSDSSSSNQQWSFQ
jgi:hypothetical protein